MVGPCSLMAFSRGVKDPEAHSPGGGMVGFGFGGPNGWPSFLDLSFLAGAGTQFFGHIEELLLGVPGPLTLRVGV